MHIISRLERGLYTTYRTRSLNHIYLDTRLLNLSETQTLESEQVLLMVLCVMRVFESQKRDQSVPMPTQVRYASVGRSRPASARKALVP